MRGNGTSRLREPAVRSVETLDEVVVVRLGGELDLYNADEVRDALAAVTAKNPPRIVIDLEQVDFVDSTALGVLIEARTRLDNRRAFVLAALGSETRRALEVSGLDRHFTIRATVDEATSARV